MFRRTKIVATVGPACDTTEKLNSLMDAGVDVFRINFSHGDQQGKAVIIRAIRELSRQRQQAVGILGDLQGPKIRTGLMKNGVMELVAGREVAFTTDDILGENGRIPTIYKQLPTDVEKGDRILLDDGLMELEVLGIVDQDVRCRVISGGMLKDRKGINLPGVKVSAPSLTEKDRQDLDFCISQEVDFIALSFVRKAADVLELKQIISGMNSAIHVISKIEKPEAVDNFDEILGVSDGIMVARGDLGVEISPEKVPMLQKMIIRKCNAAGKPVITATQMLESMVTNPRPTRAETSDVANAILDGSDAIMLSAETASGNYPIEAVQMMVQVAQDVERDLHSRDQDSSSILRHPEYASLTEAIGQAACRVAEGVGAAAILAFTQTGNTAALVSKYRPSLPIIAVTPSPYVRRRLALYSGVRSIRVDIQGDTEAQIRSVDTAVLSTGWFTKGDVVIITMGSPLSDSGTTNLMKIHRLGS
jgi:pyruvate kinase